ncbi:MFS transporter [Limnohabitans sp. Bal53]|uniref:MFS transporter n=1 Tax=Limnohabitans sp. Bal53 TaxID=1977910 RepID=UPI000D34E2A6|nr:MFS transporter [Limnohabitans sp. Bal53]PUE39675.1 MFS transporter [Limnohabitans sp. Bal53]
MSLEVNADHPRVVRGLLNIAHALDHLFLLIFAAAVSTIALDMGLAQWQDLMPYGAGAFFMFGLGSLPAGRLGDLWGRRSMMLVFFFGIGAASILTALAQTPWQLAACLTLIGVFASIYHPVGIPMLLERASNPGATIGFNGLSGNLGVAVAALLTGFLIQWQGWRAAFVVPGVLALVCGWVFARTCPPEVSSPAKRKGGAKVSLPAPLLMRAMVVMTAAAVTSSVLFNFTTNGNGLLLAERFAGVMEDPASLGLLLALVYAVASVAQVVVGHLINRFPLKRFFMFMVLAQIPMLVLASQAQGWWLFAALIGVMVFIFGAIPFTDFMIARYVDDRLRSRVSGMRLGVSFAVSSLSVWALGPVVKVMGFGSSLMLLAGFSVATTLILTLLPSSAHEQQTPA